MNSAARAVAACLLLASCSPLPGPHGGGGARAEGAEPRRERRRPEWVGVPWTRLIDEALSVPVEAWRLTLRLSATADQFCPPDAPLRRTIDDEQAGRRVKILRGAEFCITYHW